MSAQHFSFMTTRLPCTDARLVKNLRIAGDLFVNHRCAAWVTGRFRAYREPRASSTAKKSCSIVYAVASRPTVCNRCARTGSAVGGKAGACLFPSFGTLHRLDIGDRPARAGISV
jgi:hypothetical protein